MCHTPSLGAVLARVEGVSIGVLRRLMECREFSFRSDNQRAENACPLCVFRGCWRLEHEVESRIRSSAHEGPERFSGVHRDGAPRRPWAGPCLERRACSAAALLRRLLQNCGRCAKRRRAAPSIWRLQKLTSRTKRARCASRNGETLAGLMTRAGASPARGERRARLDRATFTIRAGCGRASRSIFSSRAATAQAQLTGVAFRSEPGASVTANRTTAGGFAARQVLMPLTFEIARIAAPVETSLYASALAHRRHRSRRSPRWPMRSRTTSTSSATCGRATISNWCSSASTTTKATRCAPANCCSSRWNRAAAPRDFYRSWRPAIRAPIGTTPTARARGAS